MKHKHNGQASPDKDNGHHGADEDAHARRRFTLAHEWKHLLDYTTSNVLYRHLGHGNTQQRKHKVERIADHSAACLLMPRTWVKNSLASGIQTFAPWPDCSWSVKTPCGFNLTIWACSMLTNFDRFLAAPGRGSR